MYSFICVGERVINLALVTDVAWEDAARPGAGRILRVHFGADSGRSLSFKGPEAGAVWGELIAECVPPASVVEGQD